MSTMTTQQDTSDKLDTGQIAAKCAPPSDQGESEWLFPKWKYPHSPHTIKAERLAAPYIDR